MLFELTEICDWQIGFILHSRSLIASAELCVEKESEIRSAVRRIVLRWIGNVCYGNFHLLYAKLLLDCSV